MSYVALDADSVWVSRYGLPYYHVKKMDRAAHLHHHIANLKIIKRIYNRDLVLYCWYYISSQMRKKKSKKYSAIFKLIIDDLWQSNFNT